MPLLTIKELCENDTKINGIVTKKNLDCCEFEC